MDIGEFLRPTKPKILLTVVFLLFAFVGVYTKFFAMTACYGEKYSTDDRSRSSIFGFCDPASFEILELLTLPFSISFLFVLVLSSFSLVDLGYSATIFWNYLLASLVLWLYNRHKTPTRNRQGK
ncbi:MAG: hypothetical protein HY519_01740 [Candidatus Aenigmarchaeota archaeon]|nr:hypothetical protein [Candidatus Aenigmarchaeota archaeon]